MTSYLVSVDAIQERVGKLPGPRDLKVIDFLDAHAIRWLEHTALAFFAVGSADGISITLAGGRAGFAVAEGPDLFRVSVHSFDEPEQLAPGKSFGSLCVVPGIDETLRINGRVNKVDDDNVELVVQECYLHCGKALIRSEFWSDQPLVDELGPSEFVTQSRLLALATMNSEGQADLSPKGDPAGLLLKKSDDTLWFPDRPGNRRIDSFRNIIARPAVAAVALVPGCDSVLNFAGAAEVTDCAEICDLFKVRDKTPRLATRIELQSCELRKSRALAAAELWPPRPAPNSLVAVDIFKDHVKLSKEKGLLARINRTAVSVPGLLQRGLDSDYKKNLY